MLVVSSNRSLRPETLTQGLLEPSPIDIPSRPENGYDDTTARVSIAPASPGEYSSSSKRLSERDLLWSSEKHISTRYPARQASDRGPTTVDKAIAGAPEKAERQIVSSRYVVSKEWEGVVDELGDDVVTARLFDVNLPDSGASNSAVIPLGLFSPIDRNRLRTGAIFRWVIGIERRGSTQSNLSTIVVRHLPAWSKRDVKKAFEDADNLLDGLVYPDEGFLDEAGGDLSERRESNATAAR